MTGPDPDAPSTAGMVNYDAHSNMQDEAVRSKAQELERLVEAIGVVPGEFLAVDYGCGPAHSAMDAVKPVVAAYRKLDPSAPIAICHQDQPANDWNALMALAFGPDGYQAPAVRTATAVGSFYETMAAPGAVALATCFAASHWLHRGIPVHAPETVWFADLEGEARQTYAGRAYEDWSVFLRCRAEELRPGGYLFVNTLGAVPDSTQPNGIRAAASKLYRGLFLVAKSMVEDGLVPQSALDTFTFPLWFLTADEAVAPTKTDPDLSAAFEVIDARVEPAAFNPRDVYIDMIDDPAAYAKAYRGYIQAFGESSVKLHFLGAAQTDPAKTNELSDIFFSRAEDLYRRDGAAYASETLILSFIARRK